MFEGAAAGAGAGAGLPGSGVDRVFMAQGRPAVLPLVPPETVAAADRAGWVPEGSPRIVLEGGTELASRVFRVSGVPVADRLAPARWMAPGVFWSATALRDVRGAGLEAGAIPSTWVALVEAPSGIPERRLAQFVRVNERVIELTWLAPAPQNPDVALGSVAQVSAESVRGLGELLRGDAADPQKRWRVRLLAQRYGASALWGERMAPGFGGAASTMSEPLEAAAEQLELNVRSAIDALRKHDRGAALELLNRLTAVVRTPDGVLLPAWPSGDEGVTRVVVTLLTPGMTGSARVEAARRWLDETKAAQVWMIDDIGAATVSPARFEPSVGVADLAGSGGRAWATTSAAFRGQELEVAVPPSHAVRLRMAMPLDVEGGRPMVEAGLNVSGSARGEAVSLAPIVGRVKVRPPGFALGPVFEPWTLGSWRARSAIPTGDVRGATVVIQRAAGSGVAGAWEAVVRCKPGVETVGDGTDVVRLWCGAFENARGVVRVSPAFGAEWVRAGAGAGERGARLRGDVMKEAGGGWSAVVTLPVEALEDASTLIVGVEREQPAGVRAAYPRPMLPGQGEPGRIALDLSAWGGIGPE